MQGYPSGVPKREPGCRETMRIRLLKPSPKLTLWSVGRYSLPCLAQWLQPSQNDIKTKLEAVSWRRK
jgi:hypothetical protein